MSDIEREVDDDNDTDREHCSSTHKKKITVGVVGERGCFPFLFFTREIKMLTFYMYVHLFEFPL